MRAPACLYTELDLVLKTARDLFTDDIEMSQAELVAYQLTISNFVAAVERGTGRAEVEAWRTRDPIARFRAQLLDEGGVAADELDAITTRVKAEIEEALAFAEASPEPDPATATDYIYA